ncbi:ATP-binding protein [Hyalangium rubrum]|uniref:histidine kinase n=1 Tax=Hyalangium rubrum TaxID=3103134 RepID=A0ABU5HHT0_9BACT|nr:ATP-binding protein [Hyalangium sp. s54d21]MDY7232815.1 ATP-binding protein [Hyalangium sp. s54d21]
MLSLAFVAVVGSFLVTNLIVQRSSAAVGTLSEDIIYNSAPSIEHLTLVRRSVLEAELLLSRFIHEPSRRPELGASLEAALARVKEGANAYLTLSSFAGEQAVRMDVHESWLRFDNAVKHARAAVESNASAEASSLFVQEVEPAGRHILEDVTRGIEYNAVRGRELAASIRETRRDNMWLANGLNAVCGLLAVVVAWLLHREARTRRALFDAHSKFLEERAAELEQFAGRVAHDIRNPLSAARMAAELAMRKSTEAPARESVTRIIRSLSRADAITGALLDFARSGARPDPGARTEPRAVIADMLGGFAGEAEQVGISLQCEPVPPVLVSCSTGVYLSLLGNLVRNAIKYMGDAEMRRVTVRVKEEGNFIRTEVSDTGPGIASANLASLFEPYFRGQGVSAEGLGLGLATVKKLAEGHGGRVGVTSERGQGSTFWFELRRAGSSWEPTLGARQPELHH